MKVTHIGKLFVDRGWDSYSLVQLEPEEIAACREIGEAQYVSDRLAAWPGLTARAYRAGAHPTQPHAHIVIAEVRTPA